MVKQIYQLSLIILLLALSACNGAAAQSAQPSTSAPASPPAEQVFIEALQQRIGGEKLVPEFAQLEILPLFVNKSTFAFRENQGVVLQLNIFGYPDPKETKNIVDPLITTGANIADQHKIALSGIEVVFHRRDNYNPMQVWANTPPWNAEQMFLTPLTEELIEDME